MLVKGDSDASGVVHLAGGPPPLGAKRARKRAHFRPIKKNCSETLGGYENGPEAPTPTTQGERP